MKLKCLIIDDEPSGRKVIEEHIGETAFLELIGKAENPEKAFPIMEKNPIDLIFLDIQMPKINGIDFLKSLIMPPMVIITTAFPEFALEGFDLDVIDYLLKPISLERFLKASNKAKEFYAMKNKELKPVDYFFVKCNNKFEKVLYNELLYVEAANNYVLLHTKNNRLITYLTFKGIEESLPVDQFIKVHKSFIVSLSKIERLDSEEIKIESHTIPISRNLKDEVMEKIINKSLIKR
ncbi:MAG TPA: LytTR family DNA-binding domain-containing protein [Saprospiraceae bacterium]|nr:LytTR family DNA-binding domain-containing protein [Saprospiraceae bacterium]